MIGAGIVGFFAIGLGCTIFAVLVMLLVIHIESFKNLCYACAAIVVLSFFWKFCVDVGHFIIDQGWQK